MTRLTRSATAAGRHFPPAGPPTVAWRRPLFELDRRAEIVEEACLQILDLKVLAEIDMPGSVWCSPIFARGVLYVATRDTLYAIAGRIVYKNTKVNPLKDSQEVSSLLQKLQMK